MKDVLIKIGTCQCFKCKSIITIKEVSADSLTVSKNGEILGLTNNAFTCIGKCENCGEVYNNIGRRGMYYYIESEGTNKELQQSNPFVKITK